MTLVPATPQCHLPAAGHYRLDPDRSGITFRTRHLFGLAAVNGLMRLQSGTLVLDPAAPQAWVTATVSADSLSTGEVRRQRMGTRVKQGPAPPPPLLPELGGCHEVADFGLLSPARMRHRRRAHYPRRTRHDDRTDPVRSPRIRRLAARDQGGPRSR